MEILKKIYWFPKMMFYFKNIWKISIKSKALQALIKKNYYMF
uniref:Uncharacterized protein n=1 Tax=viral metagenome TaxID=1070528 RepID=A0A6C0KNW6_9ZZZZ